MWPRPSDTADRCQLCGRIVPSALITLHHLKPKEKGGKAEHRTPLCKPCHKQLHAMFSNDQLDKSLACIKTLRADERLQPFLKWIRKQDPGRNFQVDQSTQHPHSKRRRLEERRRHRR